MSHTPGPWIFTAGRANHSIHSDNSGTIAIIPPDDDNDYANAKLIAAAPVLFEALNDLVAATAALDGSAKSMIRVVEAEKKATAAIELAAR